MTRLVGRVLVRVYYGWWIVAISMIVLLLTIGSTLNAFGLFVIPVSEDFDLSRADVNTGIIFTNLGMAAVAPIVGRMLDTQPVRRIMVLGAVLFGGSMVALGLSHTIWASAFVLALPLALGIAAVGTLTTLTLVARWFEAQRGRAMALTVMGMSLGSVVMAPLVGLLIDTVGWRQCLILLGGVLAAVFLTLVPFMRDRPGPNDVEPRPASVAAAGQGAVAQAASTEPLKPFALMTMPKFWMLSLGTALAMGSLQAIMVSIVPIGQEQGLSVTRSASLISMLGAMAILGKLVLVWLGDRLDRTISLAILFGLVSVTSFALLFGDSYPALMACSAFLGLAAGATMPIFLALLADRVGAASFGTANGIASFMMAAMGAVAIRFGGEIYDRTGGYDAMFVTFAAVSVLAAFLTFASAKFTRMRTAKALV